MTISPAERVAATLVALEGAALVCLSGWEVVALAGGDSGSTTSAVALLVLTLVGSAAVIAFAVATARGQSWGRSGGVVTQLLILAVAAGALTGVVAQPGTALALAVPAIVTFAVLIAASRRAGSRRTAD